MRRALLAFVLTTCLVGTAAAYSFGGARWELRRGQGVPYTVNMTLSADVPDQQALEAVQIGYDVWTALPCSFMQWDYAGRTQNRAWGAGDGENVASWREDTWDDSPTALAIASTIWGGAGGGLTDTDIKFNGFHHQWAHFRDGGGGFDGRTDIASVGAHESGHCIGLGHSDVAGSTMWPSTGPGDISGRSLGADDIQGACEIYPSGGEVPDPEPDGPPPPGNIGFGEDCSMGRCAADLFCVSDGRDSYCSQACEPGDDSCGPGYYCAQLAQGDGACVRGEDPAANLGAFGEECGAERGCQPGLVCVNDEGTFYCTGPCLDGECPGNYYCSELQSGDDVCVRGDGVGNGELPGSGQPCTDRGLCQRGLFCLNDSGNVDENTGEVVPYCTEACDDGMCEPGFRCVDVAPSGTACRLIPSAGQRDIGQDCWVNPEAPWRPPECGDGLICVGWHIGPDQMVDEKGICTKNCAVDDCCPEGWGCLEVTPIFGQCAEGEGDSSNFECMGPRPDPGAGGAGGDPGGGLDGGAAGDGGVAQDGGGGGGSDGCSAPGHAPTPWGWFALLAFGRRRRREG